jgi:hypothetical protein
MAIMRYFGKPTLFLIITAYPNWREVREALQQEGYSLTAFDRPDIVNWVFCLMVDALIDDI